MQENGYDPNAIFWHKWTGFTFSALSYLALEFKTKIISKDILKLLSSKCFLNRKKNKRIVKAPIGKWSIIGCNLPIGFSHIGTKSCFSKTRKNSRIRFKPKLK